MVDNGSTPAPMKIEVEAAIDLPNGIVSFTEKKVDGLIMLQPKVIKVPIQTIMIMGAQILLAMNGISTGAVKVTKDGNARPAGPDLSII